MNQDEQGRLKTPATQRLLVLALAWAITLCSCGESAPDPIYLTTTAAPCALDRTAAGNMAQALRDRDLEAIAGLVERKQVVILAQGTRFAVSSEEPGGMLWGFVRSGRNSGKDCYIVAAMVQRGEPNK